jgi:rhamnopyranosyl-N-acetylglucosaminyl-diphospho-decaprenol beta-1,3/1,4-galactofuranosyltransferase
MNDGAAEPRVLAVIVTHNRFAVLRDTITAVRSQVPAPQGILVVDTASDDGTARRVEQELPGVECLALDDNAGPAGGFAAGLSHALGRDADMFWLLDDDSAPEVGALASLLRAASARPQAAAIGMRGGLLRHGRIVHVSDPAENDHMPEVAPGVFVADFAMNDGSLISRRLVETVGVPRADLFIMMEDIEYTFRAQRDGLEICVLDRDRSHRLHLGAQGGDGHDPLWRHYYQTRNHVRIALDSREPQMIVACAARQVYFLVAALRAKDRRGERFDMRWKGIVDGVRGRMGRTLEPGARL